MPELPDVETWRRYLDATALHQEVDLVRVPAPRVLAGTTPQGLGHALKGRRIDETCRHGKYLFARLDTDGHLVLHFGMTGQLRYSRDGESDCQATACIHFSNGAQLDYIAPRKLGRIALSGSVNGFVAAHQLGPDALSIDAEQFADLVQGRHGAVKSWLMNQHIMAGIGNVYSDEILFQARIHPRHQVKALDSDGLSALHEALHEVLEAAIEAGADPERMPESFLLPHRLDGGRCPCCDAPLDTTRVGGRTAWYCPRCQTLN
ncbi:Fpg/Nei family DNA glycosylase [Wenzhouxiangella sp. XN24]|uniref:Fpg/Nei family DNA glycosylase n=1 Tax=Wenzhouxiangella sp. XN24 TaxID=2713569 RepID=UPI0013EB5BF1|nr:Fpg/Nei family DNA glycosylase [Wenzhouxiangella sp. XN24]NGX15329.1 Fpg/Nei family DNA glycosylase [Wenzhouxiangella sp. XN24]